MSAGSDSNGKSIVHVSDTRSGIQYSLRFCVFCSQQIVGNYRYSDIEQFLEPEGYFFRDQVCLVKAPFGTVFMQDGETLPRSIVRFGSSCEARFRNRLTLHCHVCSEILSHR